MFLSLQGVQGRWNIEGLGIHQTWRLLGFRVWVLEGRGADLANLAINNYQPVKRTVPKRSLLRRSQDISHDLGSRKPVLGRPLI